jgi:hypothetical protein
MGRTVLNESQHISREAAAAKTSSLIRLTKRSCAAQAVGDACRTTGVQCSSPWHACKQCRCSARRVAQQLHIQLPGASAVRAASLHRPSQAKGDAAQVCSKGVIDVSQAVGRMEWPSPSTILEGLSGA